jgi:DNA-binding LacI/PurR family transcriptional regulator
MEGQRIRNMEEFAAVSGISRPTVSKYFNDPESVRQSTRQRIEAALERYDYRPNIFAMNQNRRLTKNVGIVVPYLADPTFAEMARNIERRCIEAGFRPSLFSAHGERQIEREILDALRSLRPAGVILAPLGRHSDAEHLKRFCEEVPTVLLDRSIDGVGHAFVGSDNNSFVNQSVDYLLRTGEPPVFFEMENPKNPNSLSRRNAYISVMESHGLEPMIHRVRGDGWVNEEIGYQGALRALNDRSLPTDTILCSNDRLAVGFLAACYEKGFRVGRGPGCALRVASHDDHPYARFTCPSLTTVGHDFELVSNRGVELLFDLIERGDVPGPSSGDRTETLFPARLVLRHSA